MFIKRFLPVFYLFAAAPLSMDTRSICNIALVAGVSASGVRRCRFDEHALLAHDPAHKHSVQKRAIQENIHET
jgi:hypothetical protein